MRYADGVEVKLGDRVRLFGVQTGIVLFSIDTGEYTDEFPEADWAYLGQGVMIWTDDGALVHVDESQANEIEPIREQGTKEEGRS